MKTTRYFEEQVLRKRSYLKREWCKKALAWASTPRGSAWWTYSLLDVHPRIGKIFAGRNFGGWGNCA